MGDAGGSVGVLKEVGGQGEERGEWALFVVLFGGGADEMVAEELVGVDEVVGGEEDGCLLGRTGIVSGDVTALGDLDRLTARQRDLWLLLPWVR